ncbi:MAG: tryptophan--tRNA ligase, partial [Telluria sp.]|nr:tryptophan--tRNA ligase [Telluria sp.]
MYPDRVVSGMRPTGTMHLGHYHGALKNWIKMQSEQPCLFFVADWHALTTHYDDPTIIERSTWDMVIDWLAAGVDPSQSTIFIQSRVPEHAELHLLLSMCTPLGWLERVPTYKDQIDKLRDRDLATYGFLGYPLLQAADILIYKANYVPVGEDQSSHVELTREVARRFNHLYGRAPSFDVDVAAALARMGKDDARYYDKQRKAFGQTGTAEALSKGEGIVRKAAAGVAGWSEADTELLMGHLRGSGKSILVEPQALHTEVAKLPGLDGAKMSKSYGNAILMRDDAAVVTKKVRGMATDPARVRRTDPGNPEKCPVWNFHKVYSDSATQDWVV